MKKISLPLACQLLFAIVLVGSLAPRESEAQAVVPLKAVIAINESLRAGNEDCPLFGDISGTGAGTHLGKVTLESTDCIIPLNPSLTAFVFFSNEVVLTVSNGDQIFAAYKGTLTAEGPVGVIIGGYQITGGTGRFRNATGTGALQGTENMITREGQIQLNGILSF